MDQVKDLKLYTQSFTENIKKRSLMLDQFYRVT